MAKYWEGIGRRKSATARVRLTKGGRTFIINDKKVKDYFAIDELCQITKEALPKGFGASVKIKGGGSKSQAEAIRLGIARALIKIDEKLRPELKVQGFLRRDPRKKERKKPGLKKARRAPQWQKR